LQAWNQEKAMHTVTLPLDCAREGVVYHVEGFERRRNHGPILTLATGVTCEIPGIRKPCAVRDVVTLMRLADLLSDKHGLPVNAHKFYGPCGRRSSVGRTDA
jgi:hypothetical protein